MAKNKFTPVEKVERAKSGLLRALQEIKSNPNKTEALGFVAGQIAHTFALLDSDSKDEMAIVFVAVSILDEIDPKERKTYLASQANGEQLALTEREK